LRNREVLFSSIYLSDDYDPVYFTREILCSCLMCSAIYPFSSHFL
jgi:hypothetical protein